MIFLLSWTVNKPSPCFIRGPQSIFQGRLLCKEPIAKVLTRQEEMQEPPEELSPNSRSLFGILIRFQECCCNGGIFPSREQAGDVLL